MEVMPEAREPVISPAYKWFVRFKYTPVVAQLETDVECLYDHEMAF